MKDWLKERKVYAFSIALLLVGGLYYVFTNHQEEPSPITTALSIEEEELSQERTSNVEKQPEQSSHDESIMVDVKGQVRHPGVYPASVSERVVDVITRAGGLTEVADASQVNFALHVEDEMVIYIPAKGEQVTSISAVTSGSLTVSKEDGQNSGKININKADERELETLPGIGPAKAAAILEYRNTSGPFKSVEDLKNISGIGDKTYEKLKDLIDVH